MRVIAGKARRLILKSVPGFDTRPTIDKIKETLFNILAPYISGSSFLDLFSGSGSIGIEALSRGASLCAFVDNDPKAVRCIKENLDHTHLGEDALVIPKNALAAINELSIKRIRFDIVYMDPPYKAEYEEPVLEALARSGIIDADTMIIIEADRHNKMDFLERSQYAVYREKEYKTNKHVFLRLKDSADGELN